MDNVPINEMDLMQYPKIKAAVHLDKLGVRSLEFRVIERADDEARNVYEFRLNIQDLCAILQLGFNTMGRCAICKQSPSETKEEVMAIVNCC